MSNGNKWVFEIGFEYQIQYFDGTTQNFIMMGDNPLKVKLTSNGNIMEFNSLFSRAVSNIYKV